jgi:hypothetical protein
VAEQEQGTDRLRRWVEILTPTGILVGLLYYFGYVTTDAWFRYFGLELSQVQLPQQAIILQSIAALYVPVGALLLLGLGVYLVRRRVDGLLETGWRPRLMRIAGPVAIALGVLLLVRALIGVLVPDVSRTEPIALSPLCLCAGVLLIAGGTDVMRRTRRAPRPVKRPDWTIMVMGALLVLGLFWATNSVASAYGRGRAMDYARTLGSRPAVVVDTKERLFVVQGDVEETQLSAAEGADYRYRYRNLRLLASSQDKLYLAPADWRPGAGAVIVLPDSGVRLQFLR